MSAIDREPCRERHRWIEVPEVTILVPRHFHTVWALGKENRSPDDQIGTQNGLDMGDDDRMSAEMRDQR